MTQPVASAARKCHECQAQEIFGFVVAQFAGTQKFGNDRRKAGGGADGKRQQDGMQQRAAEILAHEIAQPEQEERRGNHPVGQDRGEHGLQHRERRSSIAHPPEMTAHYAHQVPRTVFFQRLTIHEHGGQVPPCRPTDATSKKWNRT